MKGLLTMEHVCQKYYAMEGSPREESTRQATRQVKGTSHRSSDVTLKLVGHQLIGPDRSI